MNRNTVKWVVFVVGVITTYYFLITGVTVALEQPFIFHSERDNFVEICIVLSGLIERNVTASISTSPVSAQGLLIK